MFQKKHMIPTGLEYWFGILVRKEVERVDAAVLGRLERWVIRQIQVIHKVAWLPFPSQKSGQV